MTKNAGYYDKKMNEFFFLPVTCTTFVEVYR